jgi:hypothetical protein
MSTRGAWALLAVLGLLVALALILKLAFGT